MAYYFLYPEKDTTIYSHPYRQDLNTGIVETLSLASEADETGSLYYPSRILLQFKDSELTEVLRDRVSGNFSASLKLYATEYSKNLPVSQTIELYPLNESWQNGTQRYLKHPYFQGVTSNGASWLYNDNGTDKTSWETSSFDANTTGSFSGSNEGGGTWYTGSGFESTQSIEITNDFDLNFNVTSQIQKYSASLFTSQTYPDGISNNGFVIKRRDDVWNNTTDQGTLKYFSIDTNTIFSPTLAVKWDDSSYVTSSGATILTSGKIQLNINNNKGTYRQTEEPTFRINSRKQYPNRAFVTSSNYLDVNYLNSASYYSIEDYTSKEVIIPFDTEFTKLSADSEGMYFKLYMQGLQPERYYRILIRHDNNDGISIYDDNYFFKVVR
jgi:hypothetical protein